MKLFSFIFILATTVFLSSCRKDSFITTANAKLSFSTELLTFDTVFTATGSITKSLMIKNDNNQKLRLNTIKLAGGNNSFFKTNINGIPTSELYNIEMEAFDSLYIFVQVTINPTTEALPFIVNDSLQIIYNGNERKIHLEAWGQNAHFLKNEILSDNETWTSDLPYVIIGGLTVPEGKKLTINEGSRIFLHADAPIIVHGTLEVNGTKDSANRVYFTGDRMDAPYKNFPASWPGIYFLQSSKDNILNYAVIQNGYQSIGIEGASVNANPKLTLNECIIENAYDAGILAYNTSIKARNTLVANCGRNIVLSQGGNYEFTHVTAVTTGSRYISHTHPVLSISNTANNISENLTAVFRNCIFWGSEGVVKNEVEITKEGDSPFSVLFDHVLWRMETTPSNVTLNQIINTTTPLFDSINTNLNYFNFRLKDNAPAIDKGIATPVLSDLDGNPRTGLPDIGCFERQ